MTKPETIIFRSFTKLCWVSLCWKLPCWISLCWGLLCWVLWRHSA